MSKISFENKKGRKTIINKLSYPENINERVYNAIVSGVFEGFLPVTIRQKRKETRVECIIQDLVPLTDYFNGIVTKKMFLDTIHKIIQLLKNCEKNMVNSNNLDLKSELIFIDPQTKDIYCVFWPIVNNQREMPPQVFFKNVTSEFTFNPHEDNSYIEQYNSFFNGIDPFSLKNFERLVLKLQGKSSTEWHTPSVELTKEPVEKQPKEEKKNVNIEYDPFAYDSKHIEEIKDEKGNRQNTDFVFCSSCGAKNQRTSNFCVQCGTKLKNEEIITEEKRRVDDTVDFGTMVLGDDSGGTTVLGYDEPPVPILPILTRVRTDESFVIDKPAFRIGTEKAYCDLFISDNTYISRSHADIITRDERYYILDQKSTNKTYVDGKVIPVKTEVEIFSGTEIRLANEDFVFSIEA